MGESTAATGNHLTIDVEQALSDSMKRRLQALGRKPSQEELPTIYRVPSCDRDAYEPKMMPIGPYHRHKHCFQAMKDLKWRYLSDFLARSANISLDTYIKEVKAIEPQARSCYSEAIPMESNDFTKMMVLDGCFMLEFFIKWVLDRKDPFFTVGWNLPMLRTDLLKLENQIPFLILHRIFDLSKIGDDKCFSLVWLASNYLTTTDSKVLSRISHVKIHHLLHLYHLCELPTPTSHEPRSDLMGSGTEKMRSRPWLLRYVNPRSNVLQQQSPRAIPSAKELKEAGVRFRRKKNHSNFLEISFRKGIMEIPCLSIEYATKVRFQNLIALEQCYPAAGDHLSSYAVLMDCLVNTKDDVIILQGKGIIENKLGDDDKAALFFNQLCDCAYLDYEKHYLVGVFRDVRNYCESKRHKWRAKLMQTHLSSPWTIISLVAASVLLVLTFLQTFYTIFPFYNHRS